jgi:hypothetical protein
MSKLTKAQVAQKYMDFGIINDLKMVVSPWGRVVFTNPQGQFSLNDFGSVASAKDCLNNFPDHIWMS